MPGRFKTRPNGRTTIKPIKGTKIDLELPLDLDTHWRNEPASPIYIDGPNGYPVGPATFRFTSVTAYANPVTGRLAALDLQIASKESGVVMASGQTPLPMSASAQFVCSDAKHPEALVFSGGVSLGHIGAPDTLPPAALSYLQASIDSSLAGVTLPTNSPMVVEL